MFEKKYYLCLDCETAAPEFVTNDCFSEKERKEIALSRPLIYDVGWCVFQRDGKITAKRSFLVAEVFSVPSRFNTAYYRDKRPLYLEAIRNGEIEVKSWSDIMTVLDEDIKKCEYFSAYNCAFDCRALHYTNLFMYHLYHEGFEKWLAAQAENCLLQVCNSREGERVDTSVFNFRGHSIKLFDVWNLACKSLINTRAYKQTCLAGSMISDSGLYFKTSAESTFRYLSQNMGFTEAHTALSDAEIEMAIAVKILKRSKLELGIEPFPFKKLGTVCDYFLEEVGKNRKPSTEDIDMVIGKMVQKIESYGEYKCGFRSKLESCVVELKKIKGA